MIFNIFIYCNSFIAIVVYNYLYIFSDCNLISLELSNIISLRNIITVHVFFKIVEPPELIGNVEKGPHQFLTEFQLIFQYASLFSFIYNHIRNHIPVGTTKI